MGQAQHDDRRSRKARQLVTEVAHVHAVGAHGEASSRDWVRCERSGGSVPAERCVVCPECAALTTGPAGDVTAVRCIPLPARSQSNESRPHRLSVRVPTVGDVMTRNVLCVRPDLSLDSLMTLFVERSFKAVPVVNDDGVAVGLVSESDVLVDVYARGDNDSEPPRTALESPLHAVREPRTVADVMMPLILSVPESAALTQAAALMAFEAVNRIVVRGNEGQVVGLLSASDVLFWLAKTDGYVLPSPRRLREAPGDSDGDALR